jgi:phage gp16-like protein
MSATAADPRRAVLAKVHIAKKEMRLVDADYRAILLRVTGQNSSAKCSEQQLVQLLEEFKRLGWKPKGARPISPNPQVRMIYAIWKDIRPLLDGVTGNAELRAFVRRQTKNAMHPDGVDAPEFLDPGQISLVIEGLKGWRARLRANPKNTQKRRLS